MSKPNFHIVDSDGGPTTAAKAFEAIDRAHFPDLDEHPLFGEFTRRLYRTINPGRHPDRSFVVAHETGPVAAVAATVQDGEISMFGLPAVIALRRDLDAAAASRALAAALAHLDRIGAADGATRVRLRGGAASSLGPLDMACIGRLAKPIAKMHAVVDLAGGEDAIRRGVRDSYRSLINWGRKQLIMTYVNRDNPDRAAFDSYPAFHTRVAGAGARGESYWNVIWEEIARGRAELSLGHLDDGNLVAGTLTAFAGTTVYYASGVYDRERFEKPLGHWPVFDAMARAGARGMTRFDLGEIVPRGEGSDKETQIGFFKKGFTDRIALWIEWRVPLAPPAAPT
ncbi:MAG: GNAT family N-acetyltransferase [Rhodospirillales bacterium]|nr:GNAT family N-acetyltransferase [Rhodospirillales bacterium]